MGRDSTYESQLEWAVQAHHRNAGDEPATVNTIRAAAEKEIGLSKGFFKSGEWKDRSKRIIQAEFARIEAGEDSDKQEEQPEEIKKSLKRPSPEVETRPRKKSKVEQLQEETEDESTALSEPPDSEDDQVKDEIEKAPKQKKQDSKAEKKTTKPVKESKSLATKQSQPKAKKKAESDAELSDAPSPIVDQSEDESKPTSKVEEDDTSSELSSVIDDPEPVRKKSKAKNGDSKPSKPAKSSSKPRTASESDPNAEEIKRLQGWLAKCGVRKVWGKELKPYETSKAKISHLKSLLSDVGMTGRYSNEKAAQIKEARELAADIEAVQEGNERWGKNAGDEDEDDEKEGRPKRRLIRGAQNYDFLSSDGEETD